MRAAIGFGGVQGSVLHFPHGACSTVVAFGLNGKRMSPVRTLHNSAVEADEALATLGTSLLSASRYADSVLLDPVAPRPNARVLNRVML